MKKGIGAAFDARIRSILPFLGRDATSPSPKIEAPAGRDTSAGIFKAPDLRRLADYLKTLSDSLREANCQAMSEQASLLSEEALSNPFNVVPLCRFGEALRIAGREQEYCGLVRAVNLVMFAPLRNEYLRDFTDFERQAYFDVATKCAQMPESIASTVRFVEYVVNNNIPGDFVECGVFMGATPYVIGKTLTRLGKTERRIFMYDTFEGFPNKDPIDIPYSPNGNYADMFRAMGKAGTRATIDTNAGQMASSIETTRANVELSNYPRDKLIFVKGMVEDTIPAHVPDQIAILRLDTDFYQSTRHELEQLYPRLSRGGILIIDDYGFFLGSKRATDEYFAKNGILSCLFRIDEHVRAFVKP